ncbi:MAG TPA: prepilin-type N-terminal cleavage/methylation domain-containing protein [Polyangiaceae bacterium]|jgi:prepilin-type N-terminal cleavage/methylation domain-containing protein
MKRARRGHRAGFTLIELTVALVAGLIVALGIVGLSREATRTFHEEARSSAAEASLRTAVDRLRADLRRAAYMSTANIQALNDTHLSRPPGQSATQGYAPAMAGIIRLAGIHLNPAGATNYTQTLSSIQSPALTPEQIEIGGNMTCAEQFEVETVTANGPCTRITLSANSPALYRVMSIGAAQQATELNNLFQPDGASQFIVRLVDDTGRAQFLATCNEVPTAGFTGTIAWIDVDPTNTPVRTSQVTKTMGGVSSMPGGRAWVNPVQIVRWELIDVADEPAQYATLGRQALVAGVADPQKYDLVRTYVNAQGNRIDATMEVIAEYAVDLNFAFSIDKGTQSAPVMATYPFDDLNDNAAAAADVSTVATTHPQQIRTVRARLVTRAAQADRTLNIPVTNYPVGSVTQAFMYRYCLTAPCATNDGTLRWARTRTITTEVSVPNQAGAYAQ